MNSQIFDQLLDALIAEILGSMETSPRYVLIDPAYRDPLADESEFASCWREAPRALVLLNNWPKEKSPYLLSLDDRSHQDISVLLRFALEETLGHHDSERGQPRSFCAWLTPWLDDATSLAVRMARRALAYSPNDSSSVVFRYWDPRISAHLHRVLGEATWQEHLGLLGVRRWTNLVATSAGASFSAQPEATGDTTINQKPLAWRLDKQQWQSLESLSWTNRLIQRCVDWELTAPPRFGWLESIANRALACGFKEENDILRFAHCALVVHPQFDSHPQVAASIAAAVQYGQPGFGEVVSNWPETFIDELKSGGWLNSGTLATERQKETS